MTRKRWRQARHFMTGKRYTIGVLTQFSSGPGGFQDLIWRGMVDAAREAGRELVSTFKFDQLKEIIRQQLARLDIPSCFVSIFRSDDDPGAGADVFLRVNGAGRKEDGQKVAYSAHALPDGSFFPVDRQYIYAVHPLYFRDYKIGCALFELGPRDGIVYDTLQVQISSALMGSELIWQREKTEAVQKKRSDTIQELVRPMLDSISAVTSTARDKIGMIGNLIEATKENSRKVSTTKEAIATMSDRIGKMAETLDKITSSMNDLSDASSRILSTMNVEAQT
jgi:hypothetical protein